MRASAATIRAFAVTSARPEAASAIHASKLLAPDAAPGDSLGQAAAISGNTAILGAFDDSTAGGTWVGSAYVFIQSMSGWFPQAKLTADDPFDYDHFGYSVAMDGDTAVVGTPYGGAADAGYAYIFVRSGSVWTQQARLTASDASYVDYFGYSVAIRGDTAVVGAIYDDTPSGEDAGSAYVFVRSGATWTEQAHLIASDAAPFDHFGIRVAMDGDTAVVGATGDDTPFGEDAGSAYVFVRSGATWRE